MSHNQIQKLLLMGPGGAGKTCMRSIIFDNYLPRDALRLGITISLDQSQVRILNSLFLNLWDCGGQHRYVAEYLNRQKEYIFRSVGVMLFVFDINSMSRDAGPRDAEGRLVGGGAGASAAGGLGGGRGFGAGGGAMGGAGDGNPVSFAGGDMTEWSRPEMLEYFRLSMRHLREYSPHAKVFVLLHKLDLISPDLRQPIFEARKQEIIDVVQQDGGGDTTNIEFFATSIWSDSLYLAYSNVVRSLIPHRDVLVESMRKIAVMCDAVEVALYERSTFLCLTQVTRSTNRQGNNANRGAASGSSPTYVAGENSPGHYEVMAAGNSHACSDGSELRTTEVSEIIKHFKMSCMNNTASLGGFQMTTANFTALLHPFTECTTVLVVSADTSVNVELHRLNVDSARRDFIHFMQSSDPVAESMREVL